MSICIKSVETTYPETILKISDISEKTGISLDEARRPGIKQLHAAPVGTLTTDLAADAAKKALNKIKMDATSIDQLVFISECIGDYLYMDASKTIIKKIGGRDEGLIYSSDYFRGNNGTLGIIRAVGNQLRANPNIERSIITTSLLWESHSDKRRLGNTFLGDGAGAVVLQENNSENNKIMGISLKSLSQFNLISGFKYGGTLYDFDIDVIKNNKFIYGVLNKEHYEGFLNCVKKSAIETGNNVLQKCGMSARDISYIGICGFNKSINDEIISAFKCKNVIDPLSEKGFLGSLGAIEVLECFINNDKIATGEKMLMIAVGIDVNVEAMVIRK